MFCVALCIVSFDAAAQDNALQTAGSHQFKLSSEATLENQPMLVDIFMGIDFQPASAFPDAPAVTGLQDVMYGRSRITPARSGYFWAARGKGPDGRTRLVFDTNDDGVLDEEEAVFVPTGDAKYITWTISRPETDAAMSTQIPFKIRVRVSSNGNAEWQIYSLWEATLRAKSETLPVGIVRLMDNRFLAFADADQNGIYETYLDPAQPFGLGGPFWMYDVDFPARVVSIHPANKHPVVPGRKAPTLRGVVWPDSSTVTLRNDTDLLTLLVFCYQGCAGCRDLAPYLREMVATYGGEPKVQFWSVVTSADEAAGNARDVSPDLLQVIAPEAWQNYGVTPTPTVFIIDAGGDIVYRSQGTSEAIVRDIRSTLSAHLKD